MTPKPSRESAGGRVVVLTVLALLVLFGGGYVAAYLGAGAKVPRGATVSGVDIGGKTHSEAESALEQAFAERGTLEVTIDGKPVQVDAEEAGLDLDAEASVDAAGGGRSWAPTRLWDYYTGGDELDADVTVDEAALEGVLAELEKTHGTPAKDGRVVFRAGQVRTKAPKKGLGLDRDTARQALIEGFRTGDPVELELVDTDPEIDEADVQDALDEFGNPAVSGPVTLRFNKTPVKLTPEEYSPALSMENKDGKLLPVLDSKKLDRLVRRQVVDSDQAPVDATVKLVDGKPKVIPAKPGVEFETADITDTFLDVVVEDSGDRVAKVDATVKKAKFTTKDARKLGIKRRVSTFTTYYPHAEYRNVNIGRGAELIDGTVLKPGETFSLNDTVGERTAENGFTSGYIISNGVYKYELGGGVSQLATTTFNAMFFAGLKDIEHKPHSFYIDRYPIGREATVAWPTVDLRFKNDTDHGVLISASIDPSTPGTTGSVTVSMYSTKTWDITTKTGSRYNYTSPSTRTITDDDCTPHTGYSGFDIDVWRYFHKPGSDKTVKTEKFHTTYTPSDSVVCQEPDQGGDEGGNGGNGGGNGGNGGGNGGN